jgi:hypothetical protein
VSSDRFGAAPSWLFALLKEGSSATSYRGTPGGRRRAALTLEEPASPLAASLGPFGMPRFPVAQRRRGPAPSISRRRPASTSASRPLGRGRLRRLSTWLRPHEDGWRFRAGSKRLSSSPAPAYAPSALAPDPDVRGHRWLRLPKVEGIRTSIEPSYGTGAALSRFPSGHRTTDQPTLSSARFQAPARPGSRPSAAGPVASLGGRNLLGSRGGRAVGRTQEGPLMVGLLSLGHGGIAAARLGAVRPTVSPRDRSSGVSHEP